MTTLWFEEADTLVIDGLERCVECQRALIGIEERTCTICNQKAQIRERMEAIEDRQAEIDNEVHDLGLEKRKLRREWDNLDKQLKSL